MENIYYLYGTKPEKTDAPTEQIRCTSPLKCATEFSRTVRGKAVAVHNLHNSSVERKYKFTMILGVEDAHIWEPTPFIMTLSSSKPFYFPVANHSVAMNP